MVIAKTKWFTLIISKFRISYVLPYWNVTCLGCSANFLLLSTQCSFRKYWRKHAIDGINAVWTNEEKTKSWPQPFHHTKTLFDLNAASIQTEKTPILTLKLYFQKIFTLWKFRRGLGPRSLFFLNFSPVKRDFSINLFLSRQFYIKIQQMSIFQVPGQQILNLKKY